MRNKLLAKGNLISHDIVADAGQFVAQCFGRKAGIGLSNFAVIVSSKLFIIPAAQLSRLSEGPTQVTIAVLTVAISFTFTVGQPLRWDTPTVRSKIADLWETSDVTDFQHDGHRQDVADTRYCEQLSESFFEFYSF